MFINKNSKKKIITVGLLVKSDILTLT